MEITYLTSTIFNGKILFFIIIFCFIVILLKFLKRKNRPPGPSILEGSTELFKPFAFKYLHEVIKRYGPIVELSIFGQPMIILGNHDAIKEAFIKNGDNFIDRPTSCAFHEYCNEKGLIFSTGEFWKDQKKFAMSHLIRSGCQESYDKIILREIELVFNEINKKNGKSFDPRHLISSLATNIIMQMAASERYDYDIDNDFIHKNMDEIVYNFRMSNPINFFSPLKYILKSYKKFKKSIEIIRDYSNKLVKEHENSFDENNLRDYVDSFLLKMYEEEKKGNKNTTFTREQLNIILSDFLLAGSETTPFTLLFAIIYLLHHPYLQTKIQKEIDDVIGLSRYPVMADCSKLPFTHATLLETQRYASIVPLGVARIVKENINIDGYDLPKGAYVISHLYAAHFDPKYWKNPLKFDPDRFLNKNGEVVINIKSFWPFGAGLRQCMGEALARSELFLIFTALLQRYTFKSSVPELHSMTACQEGSGLSPLPFEVSFILR